jgi:hypothetical protein
MNTEIYSLRLNPVSTFSGKIHFSAYRKKWTWDAQETSISNAVQRCLDINIKDTEKKIN